VFGPRSNPVGLQGLSDESSLGTV